MYATTELRAIAVLSQWSGAGFGPAMAVDIMQVTCQFKRNTIPTATLAIPLGLETKTLQFSNAYLLAPGPTDRIAVQVYIAGTFMSGDSSALVPNGAESFLLFEGWLSGLSYKRERETVTAMLEVEHWLSGLNFASSLSRSACSKNPTALIFDADMLRAAGDVIDADGIPAFWSHEHITADVLQGDLWDGFSGWFNKLLSADRLFDTEFFGGVGKNDTEFNEAAAVFNALESRGLSFDVGEANVDLLAQGIALDLASSITDVESKEEYSLAQLTIWEKLAAYMSPTYLFDIIPLPGKALVVPSTPCLRSTWRALDANYSILARDQAALDFKARLQRPIRAVGLFNGGPDAHFLDQDGGKKLEQDEKIGVGGFYEGNPTGMVLFRQLPMFLVNYDSPLSKNYIDYAGTIVGDLAHPNGAENKPPTPNHQEVRDGRRISGDKLAHAVYMEEVLKDRSGVVAGPLRFDICPGSTICGQGAADMGEWFGMVQSVNYFIDSEQQKAITFFEMGYLRSTAENMSDAMSTDKHPLYKDVWVGDWLVQ